MHGKKNEWNKRKTPHGTICNKMRIAYSCTLNIKALLWLSLVFFLPIHVHCTYKIGWNREYKVRCVWHSWPSPISYSLALQRAWCVWALVCVWAQRLLWRLLWMRYQSRIVRIMKHIQWQMRFALEGRHTHTRITAQCPYTTTQSVSNPKRKLKRKTTHTHTPHIQIADWFSVSFLVPVTRVGLHCRLYNLYMSAKKSLAIFKRCIQKLEKLEMCTCMCVSSNEIGRTNSRQKLNKRHETTPAFIHSLFFRYFRFNSIHQNASKLND